ncbi:MAG: hypothetical protein ACYC26_12955 [Phycisphaerales bacterium]
MTKDQAIKLVTKHLRRHQPSGYKLMVVKDAIHKEGKWWYVSVGPDRSNIDRYDYYNVLAQVEQELDEVEHANISLMPPPSGASPE